MKIVGIWDVFIIKVAVVVLMVLVHWLSCEREARATSEEHNMTVV